MSKNFRVIVVNSDHDFSAELRADVLSIAGVTIVGEIDNPSLLYTMLDELPAEVILVNLDSNLEQLLRTVKQVAFQHPELSVFGLSRSDNSQLILEAMRAGMREFVLVPIDRQQLTDSFAHAASLSLSNAKHGKIICVVGSAGGVGCTTVAVNLACELSQLSRFGTVLVDLDLLSGHVATLLDVSAQFGVADLCSNREKIDQNMVEKALVKLDSGLHVLAGPSQSLLPCDATLSKAVAILNILADRFGYVVCDGPAWTAPSGCGVLDMADVVLVVMQLLVTSVRNTHRFIERLQRRGYNLDRLQLLINRYGKDNSPLHPEDAEHTLGRPVSWVLPSDWKAVSKAVNMGKPLSDIAHKSRVRDAIHQIASGIHEPQPRIEKDGDNGVNDNGGSNGKAGLLAKVLGK